MALFDVVMNLLNKAGDTVIEPRREDGHGSASGTPSFVSVTNQPATQQVSGTVTANLGTLNGAALDTSVTVVTTSLGTDGATPPTIPGTGVRGWLRSIYDTLKATLTVQGTVTANAGSGTFNTRALASGTDSVTIVPSGTQAVSGSVTVSQATAANLQATVSGTVAATQSGTWTTGRTWSLASAGDSVTTVPSGTQAVSGTVTVAQATAANLNATVSGTVSVGNFPATQAISAASLPLPSGASTSANQTTTNTTLASLDGKIPDEFGAWGYNAGTNGTLAVAANKRVLTITATAGLTAGSMTINAGQTITIPANGSITINPRANLTAPTLVFTGTTAYFVEFIE